jgi:hypothetical protein
VATAGADEAWLDLLTGAGVLESRRGRFHTRDDEHNGNFNSDSKKHLRLADHGSLFNMAYQATEGLVELCLHRAKLHPLRQVRSNHTPQRSFRLLSLRVSRTPPSSDVPAISTSPVLLTLLGLGLCFIHV